MMEIKEIRLFCKAVRQLQRDLGWQWKSDAACCGVTTAQCHALLEVADKGEVSLAGLAESLGLDRSTLSRTVDGMVEEALLERRTNPGDRRYITITLAERGRAVCKEINSTFDAYFHTVFEFIPPAQRRQVLKSFVLMADAVRQAAGAQCCNKEETKQ